MLGDDGDSSAAAIRASFNRAGMNDFSGRLSANPGITIQDPDRSLNNGNLNNDGAGLPLLSATVGRLGPAPFPSYTGLSADRRGHGGHQPVRSRIIRPVCRYVDGRHPARRSARNMAVEVALRRHAVARELVATINYNETNIFENGFLNEFRVAQANLQANIAAGRGSTFAYTGAPGTAPLPIYLAFFHGATGDKNNPASYTSTNFTNNTFLTPLATYNPNPIGFANSLYGDATPPHERRGRGRSGELLPCESRPAGRRRPHDQCRLVRVSRAAAGTAPSLCPGPAVRGQLRFRPGDGERLPELPPAACHAS